MVTSSASWVDDYLTNEWFQKSWFSWHVGKSVLVCHSVCLLETKRAADMGFSQQHNTHVWGVELLPAVCYTEINRSHWHYECPTVIQQKVRCLSHQGLQFTHDNPHWKQTGSAPLACQFTFSCFKTTQLWHTGWMNTHISSATYTDKLFSYHRNMNDLFCLIGAFDLGNCAEESFMTGFMVRLAAASAALLGQVAEVAGVMTGHRRLISFLTVCCTQSFMAKNTS